MNTSTLSIHIGNGLLESQAFDVFGGLFLLLIGAALLYTLATWRFRALQLDGETLGVRRRGPYFHGVYRYVLPNGEAGQATSVQGHNTPQGFRSGRHVTIQVMPDKPGEAREQHAPWLWTLTVALVLGGAWLIYLGATLSKRSPFTWGLIVLALAYVAHWLWKRVAALLAKMQPIAAANPWNALPIESAEALGALSPTTVSLSSPRSKSRSAGPIFIVLGLGILALALWQARGVLTLGHGIRTSGRVVELSEGTGDRTGDTFLFPVVQYTDREDGVLRFHDRTGARPSPFKVGDTVPVIYLPGKPATATIDRGPGNWAPLGWSAVMGTVMVGLGVFAVRSEK
jgi:hypothetical protein